MAEFRKRLIRIGASVLILGLIVPSPDVARAVTAQESVVTPEIVTITPSSGPLTGGDVITITGTDLDAVPFGSGYSSDSYVFFGTVNDDGGVPGRILSRDAKSMTVVVPRGLAVGAANVTLDTTRLRVTRDAGYTYLAPSITSVTPNSAPTSGGVNVTIRGVGFGHPGAGLGGSTVTSVTVDGNAMTSVVRTNPTTITGMVPSNAVVGAKNVIVTVTPSVGYSSPVVITGTGAFSYVLQPLAPTITAIAPANGPTTGLNTVKITGTNLKGSDGNAATVKLGSNLLTGISVADDKNSLTGTVPAGAAGKVNVVVETKDGRATLVNGYEYAPAPAVSSVAPTSGPVEGGARITITGSNFGAAGNPTVTIGGVAAICVALVNPTTITAVAPAGSLGPSDVAVTLDNGGGSATLAGGYTYAASNPAPAVTSISPARIPAAGGTTITFAGTDLGDASTSVIINGKCATDVAGSATSLTAKAPVGTVGVAEVRLATAVGSLTIPVSSLDPVRLTYVDITTVSPSSGPTTGGTGITITGTGFGTTPAVTIGGAAATVNAATDTSITVTSPPGIAGKRDVVVTPAGGVSITKAAAFTYNAPPAPTVIAVSPNAGLVSGGNTVTVTGSGFGDSGTPTVTFGGTAATGVVRQSSSQLTAVVPARATAGQVNVSVTTAAGTGTLENGYTYSPAVRTPLIDSVTPDRGPNTGGTVVTVLGDNFRGSNNTPATVRLGGLAVSSLAVSADGKTITFVTPALPIGYAQLRITTNEGSAVFYYAFISVGPPVALTGCLAVSPRETVYYTGSNSVTVTGDGFGDTGTPTVSVNGTSATVTSYVNREAADTDTVTFIIPNVPLGLLDISITPTNGGPPLVLNDCINLKRQLTITAVVTPSSINYGAASATFSFTTSGLQSGHSVSGVTYYFEGVSPTGYPFQTTVPTNAGTYLVHPRAAVFSAGSAANYDIFYVPATYTINGLPATVTAQNKSITYGDLSPTFTSTATGLRSGEGLGSVTYTFTGGPGGTYNDTQIPTAAGTYTITPTVNSLSPGNIGNYSFTAVTGTFTINRKPVTVTAAAKTKSYGTADPSLDFTKSPNVPLSGVLVRPNAGTVSGENVGTHPITQGDVTNANNPNYDITYVGANLTITPVEVTVTALAQTKGYGDPDPELTYTKSPNVPLSGDLTRASVGTQAGENVGTYAIQQGELVSTSNYTIKFTGANLTITAKPITITAIPRSMKYGADEPEYGFSVSETLPYGDTVSSVTFTRSGSGIRDVGTYDITPSVAVFSAGLASNYTINYEKGTLTVEAKPATVTAENKTITFGDDTPTFSATASGLLDGQILNSVTYSFSGSGYGPLSTAPTSAGTYTITPTVVSLAGGKVTNYTFTPTTGTFKINPKPVSVIPDEGQSKTFNNGATNPTYLYTTSPTTSLSPGVLERASGELVGTYLYSLSDLQEKNPNYLLTLNDSSGTVRFAITKGTVTVTPDSGQEKVYGQSDPVLTYTTSPVGVTLKAGALIRASGENVGSSYAYSIASGSGTDEYDVVLAASPPTFEITKREITITAQPRSMKYGAAEPTYGYSVSETLPFGDTISSVTFTPSGSGTRNVGTYDITPSAAEFSPGSASNYTINYVKGTLTVEKKTITVTPDSGQSKFYGAADPATFGYSLSESITVTGKLSYTGGPGVGSFPFTLGTVSPSSANYELSLGGSVTFEIKKLAVAVTADPKTREFGKEDPALTFSVSPALPNGETLSGNLARDPGTDAKTYAITQGTVTNAGNPNYSISFTGALFTITPINVKVTAVAKTKEYGDNDPTLTYTADPNVTLSGSLARTGVGTSAGESLGTHAITQGELTSTSNYTIEFTGALLTITKRKITIKADNKEITYLESLPTNSVNPTSGSLKSGEDITGMSYTYDPVSPANAGTYTITPSDAVISGNGAGNYDIVYETGTLTIKKKSVTVTPTPGLSKKFGESDPTLTYSLSEALVGDILEGSLSQAGVNAGEHSITIGSLASKNGNYSLSLTSNVKFTIDPLPVTVTPDSGQSKSYGSSDPKITFLTNPLTLPFDENLKGDLSRVSGSDVVVGGYNILQGTVDNTTNPNYSITFTPNVKFNITPINVTVTADAKTKELQKPDPAFTYIAVPNVTLQGNLTRDGGENVGEYAIRQGTLVSNANYTINFTEAKLTITTRKITIKAEDKEMTFGDPSLPTNTFVISSGDLLTGDLLVGASADYGPTTPPTNAGSYTITPSGAVLTIASGNSEANYEISYATGTLTIKPTSVTVTANPAAAQFGQVAPTFTTTVDGLLTPDTLKSTGFSFSGGGYGLSVTPPTAPGIYDVIPTAPVNLDPGIVGNYSFKFESAKYTITGSEIGALVPIQGTYLGGTPFTITGFGLGKPGDTVTVKFGGNLATGVIAEDFRTIKGLTPSFSLAEEYVAETVDVEITTAASATPILLPGAYTYLPPRPTPLVQALSPDLGPRQGRTLLTIVGTNLTGSDGASPMIYVDGNATTNVTVAADGKSVSARTPPGLVDVKKDVELFTNEGAVAFIGAYTYFAPTITAVTPDVGYEVGSIDDETVVITGTGFGDTKPEVKVGGVAVTVTAHTPTSVTVVMPPRTPGIYDVLVIPEGDIGVTKADGYEYIPVPRGDVNGLIWLDLNKNGLFDEGSDPVFPNLPLTLTLNQYQLPTPVRTPRSAAVRGASLQSVSFMASASEEDSTVASTSDIGAASAVTFELKTDENGRYDFTKLPYGKYTLTYQLPGDVTTTYEPEDAVGGVLFIVIKKPTSTANVGGVGQSTLHARVREQDGTLYPDTPFWMRWWGSDLRFNTPDDVIILTTTDAESMVEFIGNLPSGRYRVEVPGGGQFAKVTTTLDLLPIASLTGSEFIFRKPQFDYTLLAMLPDTGAGIAGLLMSASVLLFGGVAMVASDRRRRRRVHAR